MGFNEFWINNNGKKEQLNNTKHSVRKEQMDKNFHNLFDAYDTNKDGTLDDGELQGIFTGLAKFAGKDKALDASENKQAASLFAKEKNIKDADFMGFVKSISDVNAPDENKPVNTGNEFVSQNNKVSQTIPAEQKEKACKETVIGIIDDNISDAEQILRSQDLGAISGFYDDSKNEDDKLKTSNVQKVLDYQKTGEIQIINAKEGNLTRRAYYEENKQRLKDMILTRLTVLKAPSGLSFLDEHRGKYSKEQFTKIISDYIETICNNVEIDKLKDMQKQFVTFSTAEEVGALDNFVNNAINFSKNPNELILDTMGGEGKPKKIKNPSEIIPSYWDSAEPIKFEEVYKIERGTEYSQYKVEQYVLAKKEMETVANAYNKKQQFVDFAKSITDDKNLTVDEKTRKILELYSEFYALFDDNGMSELKKSIETSNTQIKFNENGIDLSAYQQNEQMKHIALNKLLSTAISQKEADFKEFLGDKTIEEYQESYEKAANDILGEDNAKMLSEAMKNDNMTVIQRYTGNASMAGMGMTVVGGILCFTPLAPLGAGLVTVGNTLAITGMAAKTGLGVADYATKDIKTSEELTDLAKDFVMDAGGFIVGMGAGKAGVKAFSKLIDKKLSAVFAKEITAGNRMQALQTVLKNPAYLKNFMTAAGAKIGTDFMISYVGDLAMMGMLDTKDDWKSLLQANLTGILVGTSGDVKDLAGIGKSAAKGKVKPISGTTGKPVTQLEYGRAVLGKEVTIKDPETGAEITGAVTKVTTGQGMVKVEVDGREYSTDDVVAVREFATPKGKIETLNDAKSTNPAENVKEKVLAEVAKDMTDEGMRLNTPESLDAELDYAERNPNAPVENLEVLSLVVDGQLGRTLSEMYGKLGKSFEDIITKHSDEIAKLEQTYGKDKQQFAQKFTEFLADKLGVKGIEPKINFEEMSDCDGFFDWANGELLINKDLANSKDLETIIAHEFVHVLQFKDIVATKGQDGVREIYLNEKGGRFIEAKTKEILEDNGIDYDSLTAEEKADYKDAIADALAEQTMADNAGLVQFAQNNPVEKGSLKSYLAKIYQDEHANMAEFDTPEYYSQVIENEAYYLGNGRIGNRITNNIKLPNMNTDIINRNHTGNYPKGVVTQDVSNNSRIGKAAQAKNELIGVLSDLTIKIKDKDFKLPESKIQEFTDLIKDTHTAKVITEYINKYKDNSFQARNFRLLMFDKLETPEDIEAFVDIIETPTIGEALKTPDSLFLRADMNDHGVNRTSVEYLEKVTEAGLDKPRGGNSVINFEEIDTIMKCEPERRELLSKLYTSKLFSRVEFYKLWRMDLSDIDLTNLDRIDAMIDEYKWCDSMTIDDNKCLLTASDELLEIISSRNLLKTIPNRDQHLTGLEALDLACVDDKTWAKIQERGLLSDIGEYKHLPIYSVREYATVPENLWENIQRRDILKIQPKGNDDIKNLYNTPDFIKRVASLTDESYSKYKELIENPTEEIFLLKTILENNVSVKSKSRSMLSQRKTEESSLQEQSPLVEIDENVFNQLKSLKTCFGSSVSAENVARVADRLFSDGQFDSETCEVLKDFIKDIKQYNSDKYVLCENDILQIFDSIVDNPYAADISRPRDGVITLSGFFRFSNSKEFLSDIQAQKQIFESIKNNEFEIDRADNLKILKHVNKNNVENIKTLLSNSNLSNENLARIIQQNTGDLLNWLSSQDIEPALAKLEAQRQKVEEKPELYINGEANDEFSINYEIGKIFDRKYAKFLRLCTIYDKEAINNLLRMRINDTEEYLYTMDDFSTKECELLKGMIESTNIDGKPFMPTQKIEFIDLINAYKENGLPLDKIESMIESGRVDLGQLNLDLFNQIMKNSGLTDAEIASIPKEKLVAWDTKYAHLLAKEIQSENDVAFSDILRAGSLEADFIDYIHNPDNVYGQANAKTLEMYLESGMNYDSWLHPSKENEIHFVSKDKNTEQLSQIASQITEDINTLMQTPVKGFLKKQFPKFIKGDEFVILQEYLSNKAKLAELVKILSDTSEQGQLAQVWKRAQGNSTNPDPARAQTARNTLTILDHLNQRMTDIDNVQDSKVTKTMDLTIKMWDRNPQKDIFQGNYSTCCIGMGGGNGSAMPHFIMDTAYNMIELVDNNTGKTVGNALCYFIKGENGKPAFIIDNIEINNSVKPSSEIGLQLRNSMVEYAARVSKEVTGSEDIPIYMSGSYNDVPSSDLKSEQQNISFLGEIDCDKIYMDLYQGWINKDELNSRQTLLRL